MGKLTSTIGIPIKLLNEAQGHVVTLEITSGQVYRGHLLEAEDNMNVQLKDITVTARDGRVSHLDQVYIRGSHIRTQYYNADVGIWVDEIPYSIQKASAPASDAKNIDLADDRPSESEDVPSLSSYKSLLLSSEAKEVRDVIGGIILTLPAPTWTSNSGGDDTTKFEEECRFAVREYVDFITAVTEIRDEIEGERGNDVAGVIALTPSMDQTNNRGKISQEILDTLVTIWEEAMLEQGIFGWDIVAWQTYPGHEARSQDATNEYGEKLGIPRIIEVLEAIDWLSGSSGLSGSAVDVQSDDGSEDDGPLRFSNGPEDDMEIRREMMGLSMAIRYPEHDQSDEEFGPDMQPEGSTLQGLISGSVKAQDDTFPRTFDLPGFDIGDEDLKIESLPGLMDRVLAIREQAAGMSKQEREKYARREIERLMGEL
ncbi:putative small nuclear ribonucleoprotein sm d3 [Phaeomoniella chlamydospora]|uniref:Putative small nuclear ribonucleoprotein sm d3 n=1 Tax=Phaeomoniella chlamydospora TaxID=158046 RepID=A0A0G2GQ20_PHACM|nr:putative small nuclear ribonucleoprotein sm d3 [Phaeomoniella chlamydospora]